MLAILNEDIIIRISEELGDTEIGSIPPRMRGVGLERLRFDGAKLVDLMDLTSIWVRPVGDGFELHAIEVPGATEVAMGYPDRDLLIRGVGGEIRLKTAEEEEEG